MNNYEKIGVILLCELVIVALICFTFIFAVPTLNAMDSQIRYLEGYRDALNYCKALLVKP